MAGLMEIGQSLQLKCYFTTLVFSSQHQLHHFLHVDIPMQDYQLQYYGL